MQFVEFDRGIDMLNTAYNYLNLGLKGQDEAGHEFPQLMDTESID